MTTSAHPRNRDTGMVRLYAWVMIVTAGLTVAFALYSVGSEPQYSASAEVLIDPTITPSGNYIQPSMPTEQRVATSAEVVATAAARMGVSSTEALQHLSVTVPVDTQVLVMTYTAASPVRAWSGANVISQTYLTSRNPANGKNAVASLVGPPGVPSTPIATNYPVILGVAILGGLLIGFAVAWTWDRVRGRIRTIGEAERRTGLGALAVLPPRRRRLSTRDQWISPGSSSLDPLAARVLGQVADELRTSLLVTGVGTGCDSTTAAAHTAIALARMGRVAFLVTADHDVAGELALHHEPDAVATTPTGLHVVPVATWDGGGVAAAQLASLLPELHDRLPEAIVVIDGPPAWQCAGMALRADKILLVVAPGRTSRSSTAAAMQALDHCPEKLMGLVIKPRTGRTWTTVCTVAAALVSIRSWAALRARRVIFRLAPPAPLTSAPTFSAAAFAAPTLLVPTAAVAKPAVRTSAAPAVWDLPTVVPQLDRSLQGPGRWPSPGAAPTLRGWTGLLGREDQLWDVIGPDRTRDVGRVPVLHPGGMPTRSSS